jgi:predicted nucleic acid-binding protein
VAALVLDASVTLTWFLEDEVTAALARERTIAEGAVAPAIWPLEVANGFRVNERRGRITAGDRATALETLNEMPIELDGETVTHAWDATYALAVAHGLTVYDATYLELAIRLGLQLASLDDALRAGARSAGIALLL